jgi:regulator of PEP synthase PpsR (kinase-PPPase family)
MTSPRPQKQVFLISDGTGITVESYTNSLLSQFPSIDFIFHSFPYVESATQIDDIVLKINSYYQHYQEKPIVFLTMVNSSMLQPLYTTQAHVFDLYNPLIDELENILKSKSIDAIGRAHGFISSSRYDQRIDAINYALATDDGLSEKNYNSADIILIGVSRCGKTPSCLYMALQFGIYAANFPITEESLDAHQLPSILSQFKSKLFGLTISPKRLQQIRQERRPHSQYASLEQCQYEVKQVESLYKSQNIPYLDSTCYSIEEISTRIINQMNIRKRI